MGVLDNSKYWRERSIVHALLDFRKDKKSPLALIDEYGKCDGVDWKLIAEYQGNQGMDPPLFSRILVRMTLPGKREAFFPLVESLLKYGCRIKEEYVLKEVEWDGRISERQDSFHLIPFLLKHQDWETILLFAKYGLDLEKKNPKTGLNVLETAFIEDCLDIAMELSKIMGRPHVLPREKTLENLDSLVEMNAY